MTIVFPQFVLNETLSSIFLLLQVLFEDKYGLEKGLGFVWKKVAMVWLTFVSGIFFNYSFFTKSLNTVSC
jgi:hypothetical protein